MTKSSAKTRPDNSFYRWYMDLIAKAAPRAPILAGRKKLGIAENLVRSTNGRLRFDPRTVREVEQTREMKNGKPRKYQGPYKAVTKDSDGAYRRYARLDGKV